MANDKQFNAQEVTQYDDLFQSAASENGLPVEYLKNIAWIESRYQPDVTSSAGASGIMQFMPATGKAMGLSEQDRYDPQKSIPAAAKLLGQLNKQYKGDLTKVALAYNQGNGRVGRKQLEAYDRGDLSGVSSEGRGYMEKLAHGKPVDVVKEAEAQTTDGLQELKDNISETQSISKNRIDSLMPTHFTPPELQFQQTEQLSSPLLSARSLAANSTPGGEDKEVDTFDGTLDNLSHRLKTSTLGRMVRSDSFEEAMALITPRDAVPLENLRTRSELQQIESSGLPASYWNPLLKVPKSDLEGAIKKQMEYFKEDMRLSKETGAGAQFVGWMGDLLGDPVTYAAGGMGGIAFKGRTAYEIAKDVAKVSAGGAVLGGTSEAIRTNVVGGDAHYVETMVGGALLAPVLGSLVGALGDQFGKDVARYNRSIENQLRGEPTGINPAGGQRTVELGGQTITDLGQGSARLPDGSVVNGSNPINPLSQHSFDEAEKLVPKLKSWVKLGGFSEIGNVTNGSQSVEIRGIAQDLFRPTVLREDGSGGAAKMVAEDIDRFFGNLDNVRQENQIKLAKRVSQEFDSEPDMWRIIGEHIEQGRIDELRGSQKALAENVKEGMDFKAYYAENPATFGNTNAKPLFTLGHTKGSYLPVSYDQVKTAGFRERFNGDVNDAADAVAKHFVAEYNADPAIKSRVDKLMDSQGITDVQVYARKSAYGIVAEDSQFTNRSTVALEEYSKGRVEANSYLEARHGFSMNYESVLPDGSTFSLNDLRSWDMGSIIPSYHRRMNGDIAIMGSRGQTIPELNTSIAEVRVAAKGDNQLLKEADALTEGLKLLTGVARRKPPAKSEQLARSLIDMSLFAKGAYMAVQNYTEGASLITNGGWKMLSNRIPFLKDLASTKSVSNEMLNEFHNIGFGKELSMALRPSRRDLVEQLAMGNKGAGNATVADKVVGSIKYGTQELVQRSPHIKLIAGTVNHMVEAARFKMIADIAEGAHGGKLTKQLKEGYRNLAGVTDQQFDGMMGMMREYTKMTDGRLEFNKNAADIVKDPRFFAMWRLADQAAEDVTLRNHRIGFQNLKSQSGYMGMLTQFRIFNAKSLNGRFMRMIQNGQLNGKKMDMALTAMASIMLSGTYQLMFNHIKASQIPDEQKRRIYLDKMNDPMMVAWSSLTRSSVTGAPLSIGQWLLTPTPYGDAFANMRSTVSPTAYADAMAGAQEGADQWTASSAIARTINQLPAINTADNILKGGYNLGASLTGNNYADSFGLVSGMMSNAQQLVPNDPLTQKLMVELTDYLNGTDFGRD